MKVERFEYPRWQKLMRLTMFVVGLLLGGCGMSAPLGYVVLKVFEHPLLERIEVVSSSTLPSFVISAVIVTGFYGVLIMHPDVEATDESFRISKLWYKSNWLAWHNLLEVRELPFSPSWNRQFGVAVEGIGPLYLLAGVTQGFGFRTTFVVDHSLRDFHRFLALLKQKRPDLFAVKE